MRYVEPKNYKEVKGYVLCSRFTHKAFGTQKAISNSGIEGDYEIIAVNKETEEAFYGTPLEGLGLIDCMVLKTDCRPFTDEELEYWSEKSIGIYGSNTGRLSYTYKINVNDLLRVDK